MLRNNHDNIFQIKSLMIIVTLIIVTATATTLTTGKQIAYGELQKAPDFDLKTIDGKQVSLNTFKGKPLVLWFMAAWCPSCVGQAGAIKQVKAEYGDKLNVLVIDLWSSQSIGGQSAQGLNAETQNDLKDFLAKYGSSSDWKAALDTDKVAIKYGVTEVDSTVVVDSNGNIVFKNLGPSGYQPLKDALVKVTV